jgi:hypothetical protein
MNPGKYFRQHSFVTKGENLTTDEPEAPGNSTISSGGEKLEGSG